jgi:hypothetical protein
LEKVQKAKKQEGKTLRERIKVISKAITANSTFSDVLVFEDFSGSITLQVEPCSNRITRIEYHFVDKIANS